MAGLRELVLKLSANTVSFRQDIGAAIRQVDLFSAQVSRSMKSANAAFIGFAAGAVSIAGLSAAFAHAVDAMAELDDMAQQTGSSVENLSRIAKVAQVFGQDMGAVNAALVRFSRGLAGVDEESSKTREALRALGLSTADIAKQDPSVVFRNFAAALDNFEDGPEKVALAMDALGKGGADLLPFLRDLNGNIDKFDGVSAEAAAQADSFQNGLRQLSSRADDLTKTVAAGILPTMNDFIGAINDVIDEQNKLADGNALADWAEGAVTAITAVINAVDAGIRSINLLGESLGALAATALADNQRERDVIQREFEKRRDELLNPTLAGNRIRERFQSRRAQREAEAANPSLAQTTPKRQLNYNPTNPKQQADLLKSQTDAALSELRRQLDGEKEILDSRNRVLDLYNGENLLSLRDYFDARKAAQEDYVRNASALYDQEIAALEKLKRSAKDEGARTDARAKINELIQKKTELQRQSSEDAVINLLKEQKAYEDLQRELRAVNAELLELQGRSGDAARIRITDQYAGLRTRLATEGDQQGLDQLDQLERAKIAQADYNQLLDQSSQIQDKLRLGEERVAIARYSGAISELESLAQISEARQQAVRDLEQIVIQQEAVAAASENPALIQQVEAARVALERLRAESDLLAKKFETIFVSGIGQALTDFVTGAKSAKEAFRDFADSVVQQITRMAAEAVAAQLFNSLMGGAGAAAGAAGAGGAAAGGGGGGGGWLGTLVGIGTSLFGGTAGASSAGAGGWLGSLVSLGASLFGGGAAAFGGQLAATDAMFPAGGAISAADLMDFPGLANGGPAAANSPYWVGEFGKELFVPETAGRVIPRSELSGGNTNVINITQNIPKEMSRQSAQQLAADTGLQVNRAVRRNS